MPMTLLWARLGAIGVVPRMVATIQSLYASGTLSMKIAGAARQACSQQTGVRQGCPLSPTLFGPFFDGLHGDLHSQAPHDDIQLLVIYIYMLLSLVGYLECTGTRNLCRMFHVAGCGLLAWSTCLRPITSRSGLKEASLQSIRAV